MHAGVAFIAEEVIDASPDNAPGVWGSDLQVQLTLSGEMDDALVDRIWRTLTNRWAAVAWDESSGFDINKDPH
ncbi:hypothetical protein [Actinomadura litoris]|uniref:Uncharacterized protein n=1 Tax=Actinomadura litoris TaxID=2678616 RepID=A0A7K1L9E0_9ACTN|nr:hypothetical protein [Actinomadura litoris]MUN41040.1 hypothetical protein [Actinomadura litoris]